MKTGVPLVSALEEEFLLLLSQGSLYGLELLNRLNEARSQLQIRSLHVGSLYPTLHRLIEKKLIVVEGVEPATGAPRVYYCLTSLGSQALALRKQLRANLHGP